MSPLVTVALLALGLGLQLIFLVFLFFDTHVKFPSHQREVVLACAAGLLGTCIIGLLAFLRQDVVLLVGEFLAIITGIVLLYRMIKVEGKESRDRDGFSV
ncbi:hypothetical protein [Desulfoplanes formicivorans]|uniref:Uncharacterized protein n=1 Tax=Desulfoplanes formicivorans TaxID=1592317 RepID=A0A194AIS4_9BACT|nr:hypothetical protein [Desulfoplanes formicivorans]GAU08649.1 hypothetical protein DPF_1365 [Desulfoplanes formicivorans]